MNACSSTGSNTISTARWSTLSSGVGIPIGRVLPVPGLVQGHPAHRRRPIPTRLEPLKQARQVRPQVRLVLRRRHPVHTRRYASPIHTASMGCASVVMSSFGSRRANSAILRGRVEMTSRPNVPAICPSASSTARPGPLPLHRVPSGQVPRLLRDYRTFYEAVRGGMTRVDALTSPPRDGRAFEVPAGHLFRIVNTEGPQVGDLNLWNANDLSERFYSGKTRALHATHVSTGDRLWSTFPHLRPMATITHDTLDWYGFDEDGAGVQDVIGTRCDPYTNHLLTGG